MTGEKKLIAYFFSVTAILFSTQILFPQSINKPYYNFETFTTADGISSNEVRCTYKDSRGFLWIGTNKGLQRYNGSAFLTSRHLNNDTGSIASEVINSITEDKQHNIWIASFSGITKFNYDNGKFTNYVYGYKEGNTKLLLVVFCFFEDSEGRKWIGTTGAGLYRFDETKQRFQHYSLAPYLDKRPDVFSWVRTIQETGKQELVFSVSDGIVIIDKQGKQQYIQLPPITNKQLIFIPCQVLPLLKDYPDEIWITANFNFLYKYNRSTNKWTHYFSATEPRASVIEAAINWNKNEWLLGHHDLYFFNHRTGIFTKAFDFPKIVAIRNIFKDDEGNTWISSTKEGLLLLNTSRQLFSSIQSISGSWNDRLIYYDSTRQFLYSIHAYTNSLINLHTVTNTISYDSISYFSHLHKVITNFIADNDILYFAMNRGMWKFDLQRHKLDSIVYKSKFVNSQNQHFLDICKSPENIYFAGIGEPGTLAYRKATRTITNLSIARARAVVFSNNILYVGISDADSIHCYNEATKQKVAIPIPRNYFNGKPASIASLCIDKKEQLWCGTYGNGVYIFNILSQKWIKHISQAEGYFAGVSAQLICDDDGAVWCNSTDGLYAFNTTDFSFKNYTLKDGLDNENVTGCLAVLPNHQLAYNNIKGDNISLGIISTKRINTNKQTIPISITNLQVLGKTFLKDTLLDNVGQVILPPNNNAFSLNFAGLSIREGKSLQYSYLLENAEKKWHDVGNEQSLSYINLDPGEYLLHIKCKTLNGQIVSTERLLHITLLPAWYQTWWFKLFAVVALSGLVFFAVRYYYLQQIKKHRTILERERALTDERNRIAADMHDDVGAGLSRIRYISSSMQSNQEVSNADINKIVSLSDEAVEKMNEIIWALNQGNQQLEEVLYYTRSQCSEMLNNAGIIFSFELPENIPVTTLAWKDCRNIYLLIKEGVNNAIKHAGATNIIIECRIADQLLVTITDDGKGFDQEAVKNNGNGLFNYKKRIENLNGTYKLITSPGNGTKLLFTIPVNSLS